MPDSTPSLGGHRLLDRRRFLSTEATGRSHTRDIAVQMAGLQRLQCSLISLPWVTNNRSSTAYLVAEGVADQDPRKLGYQLTNDIRRLSGLVKELLSLPLDVARPDKLH